MSAADRFEALRAVCQRRRRAWLCQPEYMVNKARPALNRAYRVAVGRKEIWSDGARRCLCHPPSEGLS